MVRVNALVVFQQHLGRVQQGCDSGAVHAVRRQHVELVASAPKIREVLGKLADACRHRLGRAKCRAQTREAGQDLVIPAGRTGSGVGRRGKAVVRQAAKQHAAAVVVQRREQRSPNPRVARRLFAVALEAQAVVFVKDGVRRGLAVESVHTVDALVQRNPAAVSAAIRIAISAAICPSSI